MLQCNQCSVQYIGKTKHCLSDRFGEQRLAIKKAIAKQHIDQPNTVSDHFNNVEFVPLKLISYDREAIHKAREAFLIFKGKNLQPFGLNKNGQI